MNLKHKKISLILCELGFVALMIIGCLFIITKQKEMQGNEVKNNAKKFASEYSSVSDENVFIYKSPDEIINIMKHGTGVVYLGYPECPWCQAYVPYLNEVAKDVGIDKIYYSNTKVMKETSMEKYKEIISILDGHLQYNDEGEQWIYVPNVSFHINGELIGNDYETSKDTQDKKLPKEYWTEEEVQELKAKLKAYMQPVKHALNMCSNCNK